MNGATRSRRGSREPKVNLVQIQDRFVELVNAAYARWSHRKTLDHERCGGHYWPLPQCSLPGSHARSVEVGLYARAGASGDQGCVRYGRFGKECPLRCQ